MTKIRNWKNESHNVSGDTFKLEVTHGMQFGHKVGKDGLKTRIEAEKPNQLILYPIK